MLTYADEIGPEKIIHLYNPQTGLRAVLAIDNTAAGPAIGGIRMAPDVTVEEAFRLARAMTLKNAAAGLAHGGGKSVIQADPKALAPAEKETLIRSFALAIKDLKEYIPGPDMGTDETCMAWIRDEIQRSVGLPREVGGIPLDEIGATGTGLAAAAETACQWYRMELQGARIAIQGFGAVGKHAARILNEKGAIIVAVADSRGTVINLDGLDVVALMELKEKGGSVIDYTGGRKEDSTAIIGIPCDIWIPTARPDVIDGKNVHQLQSKLVLEGANIPITEEAENILFQKGIHVIPDFIANAGGVICAAAEYHGGTEQTVNDIIRQKINFNTAAVIKKSLNGNITPRAAANQLALERVKNAMRYRR